MSKKPALKHPNGRHKIKPNNFGGRVYVEDQKVFGRTRITNGKTLLPFVDERSYFCKIMRETLERITEHCGGAQHISETRRMMARRCAVLETELIFMEHRLARIHAEGGEPSPDQVDTYARVAGNQRRIAETLGWDRAQRDVTPDDPLEYAARYDRKADEAEVVS
jgi:hypothetical protein